MSFFPPTRVSLVNHILLGCVFFPFVLISSCSVLFLNHFAFFSSSLILSFFLLPSSSPSSSSYMNDDNDNSQQDRTSSQQRFITIVVCSLLLIILLWFRKRDRDYEEDNNNRAGSNYYNVLSVFGCGKGCLQEVVARSTAFKTFNQKPQQQQQNDGKKRVMLQQESYYRRERFLFLLWQCLFGFVLSILFISLEDLAFPPHTRTSSFAHPIHEDEEGDSHVFYRSENARRRETAEILSVASFLRPASLIFLNLLATTLLAFWSQVSSSGTLQQEVPFLT